MYIVVEGVDCSGKTTNVDLLTKHLESNDIQVTTIHQPGVTPLGKKIREIVRSIDIPIKSRYALETLFQSENEEAGEYITEFLSINEGKRHALISDRCNIVSSIPYGLARDVPMVDMLIRIKNDIALYPALVPDKIIILQIAYQDYKDRQVVRGLELDRIEALGEGYLRSVIDYYNKYAEIVKGLIDSKVYYINATKPVAEVQKEIQVAIND